MIPRHIGFFWSGGKMSWLRYMTLYSYRKLNPAWPMRLYLGHPSRHAEWSSREQRERHEQYDGPDYLNRVRELDVELVPWTIRDPETGQPLEDLPPACQSDLTQWEVLHRFGGLWADLDILFIRPMSSLGSLLENVDAGIFTWRQFSVTIGFLASSPGNRFFADVSRESFRFDRRQYQGAGANAMYRVLNYRPRNPESRSRLLRWLRRLPPPIDEVIRRRYPELKIHTFPEELVYPWDWQHTEAIFGERRVAPSHSVGIHWFGGITVSQTHNARMTESNYRQFANTMSDYLEQVLSA